MPDVKDELEKAKLVNNNLSRIVETILNEQPDSETARCAVCFEWTDVKKPCCNRGVIQEGE